jgi:hypothetical protein
MPRASCRRRLTMASSWGRRLSRRVRYKRPHGSVHIGSPFRIPFDLFSNPVHAKEPSDGVDLLDEDVCDGFWVKGQGRLHGKARAPVFSELQPDKAAFEGMDALLPVAMCSGV